LLFFFLLETMLWSKLTFAAGVSAAVSASGSRLGFETGGQRVLGGVDATGSFKCDLPPALSPSADGLPSSRDLFSGKKALLKQVERHGTLVKVPSVSYDDNGEPGEDPRWDVFYELHATLAKLYPSV
jgi:Gly-Xaa carboxypeptidase